MIANTDHIHFNLTLDNSTPSYPQHSRDDTQLPWKMQTENAHNYWLWSLKNANSVTESDVV